MSPRKKPPLLPRPLDVNEEAFRFVRGVTGEPVEEPPVDHAAAAKLGKRGGKQGGKARAEKLSPAKRAEIARKAARSRWGKEEPK
jgi:hypothetical protein